MPRVHSLHVRANDSSHVTLLLPVVLSWLLLSAATLMSAQTCDPASKERPCINPPKIGGVTITGWLKLDADGHVPEGTAVEVIIRGSSQGGAQWRTDGSFSMSLSTTLAASDVIKVVQSPAASGGSASFSIPRPTQTQTLKFKNSLERNYIALQQARNAQAPSKPVRNLALSAGSQSCQPVSTPADPDTAPTTVATTANSEGTYSPFGAVFDVLAAFTDAGNGSFPSAQSGIQTEVLGKVEWESQHYGYQNTLCQLNNQPVLGFVRTPDFSFGGSIGLYPELVLENLTSTTETIAQPNARPMFQDAFHWSLGPRINYPVASHGEIGMFANFGQNFLVNQVTSFKDGDNTVVATPVSNGVGRAAGFMEAGLQGRILGRAVWVAHDNKYDILRPLFLLAGGVRKDWRFTRNGDLGIYDHPRDRVFFQFFVNLTQIVGYTNDIQKQAPASVRFGIDMDRGMFEQRIPTATRYYVSADINLMNIFKPSPPQSDASTPTTTPPSNP